MTEADRFPQINERGRRLMTPQDRIETTYQILEAKEGGQFDHLSPIGKLLIKEILFGNNPRQTLAGAKRALGLMQTRQYLRYRFWADIHNMRGELAGDLVYNEATHRFCKSKEPRVPAIRGRKPSDILLQVRSDDHPKERLEAVLSGNPTITEAARILGCCNLTARRVLARAGISPAPVRRGRPRINK